jgi:hypothetical protein
VQLAGREIRLVRPGRRHRRYRRVRPPRAPRPRDVLLARLAGSDESGERDQPSLRDNIETVAMVEAAIRSLEERGACSPLEVAHA